MTRGHRHPPHLQGLFTPPHKGQRVAVTRAHSGTRTAHARHTHGTRTAHARHTHGTSTAHAGRVCSEPTGFADEEVCVSLKLLHGNHGCVGGGEKKWDAGYYGGWPSPHARGRSKDTPTGR
jgi:hypothetical protein